ncbi:TetR/AcrR family transcriptional regulator [Nocardia flavorosea]|uniref:TetR/AcrR family transcriptional regulator n=1 Tax=Nocardia flavorosea TaxID=53429 RepID=A0A846YIU5_9NOCA|nr:TetR/AcrR family transcriptional regulator [Nocardia flavorosea]NKY57741.1 TetR/AcrR family transcriptional regulator [Nocardia flavorosea]
MVRSRTDRRGPPRGEQRREALLVALDELLRDNGGRLEAVDIAEISRRAGLTRSAFYFYFENKAAAVGAALEDIYQEVFAVNDILVGPGEPADRIERTIRGLVDFWDRHRHLYSAVLDARSASAAVRELWESERQAFIPSIAAMIDDERRAGRAPSGGDAATLADVLLLLNERLLERLTLGAELDRERYIESVVTVWLRSIYAPAEPTTSRNRHDCAPHL